MIASVAKRLIKRFGQKGAFVLERNTDVYDKNTMENVVTSTNIPLLAYAEERPINREVNSTRYSHSFELLIALDNDFDGKITEDDRLLFDSIEYDIETNLQVVAGGQISYVEVVCNA